MEFIINNEKETRDYGHKLAEELKPGQVVALIGELGTGKTTLTKAIAEGLNISEPISSPTFSIIKEYKTGRLPLYHFDVYRLNSIEEMYNLGYEEYFYGDGVTVVEWADKIEDILPEDTIRIEINYNGNHDDCGDEDNNYESRIYRRSK